MHDNTSCHLSGRRLEYLAGMPTKKEKEMECLMLSESYFCSSHHFRFEHRLQFSCESTSIKPLTSIRSKTIPVCIKRFII